MNTIPHSSAKSANNVPSQACSPIRWRWLGITLLLILVLALGSWHRVEPTPHLGVATASSATSPARGSFYIRNGMWLADAKTVANLVQYLLQPDIPLPVATNIVNG